MRRRIATIPVVSVVLSTGPAPRLLPDLTGASYTDAVARLQGLRLVPARQNAFSDSVAQGIVISTAPGAGGPGRRPLMRSSWACRYCAGVPVSIQYASSGRA